MSLGRHRLRVSEQLLLLLLLSLKKVMGELVHCAKILYVKEPALLRLHRWPRRVTGVLRALAASPTVPCWMMRQRVAGVASTLVGTELLLVFLAKRVRLVLHY